MHQYIDGRIHKQVKCLDFLSTLSHIPIKTFTDSEKCGKVQESIQSSTTPEPSNLYQTDEHLRS